MQSGNPASRLRYYRSVYYGPRSHLRERARELGNIRQHSAERERRAWRVFSTIHAPPVIKQRHSRLKYNAIRSCTLTEERNYFVKINHCNMLLAPLSNAAKRQLQIVLCIIFWKLFYIFVNNKKNLRNFHKINSRCLTHIINLYYDYYKFQVNCMFFFRVSFR